MDQLLTQANHIIRKNRPLDKTPVIITFRRDRFLQLTLQTSGCRYSEAGSCCMCNYGKGTTPNVQDIKTAMDQICSSRDFIESDQVLLGASGSFLDDYEVSEEIQFYMMQRLSQSDKKEIFLETHYKSINQAKLTKIHKLFPDQIVHIEMGLETVTKELQEKVLNKEILLEELKKTIAQIHHAGLFVSLNILLGIPFLSLNEQISDTIKSIEWSVDNGADYIVIFPINIQPFTLFEWWYLQGYISIISPWMLVELLLHLTDKELKRVCLSWYGNRYITYSEQQKTIVPYSCPVCQPELLSFFNNFSANYNIKYRKQKLQQIYKFPFSCKCRENLHNTLRKKNAPKTSLKSARDDIESWINKYGINRSNL